MERNMVIPAVTECEQCKAALSLSKQRRKAHFCSSACSKKRDRERYRVMNPFGIDRDTATVGAMHELVVSIDLLKRKYHVFRALSPSAACDLVIIKGGKFLRVEVTSGHRNNSGKISWPDHDASNYDIVAVVIAGEIHYYPQGEIT